MNKHLNLRFLYVAFFLILALILIVTLYPFNFFSPNGVKWLSNERGLYFNGYGIAYTQKGVTISEKKAVTVELVLKERFESKYSWPAEIFSFYDGSASPSFLFGQWRGRFFLYSRFEKDDKVEWCQQFRPNLVFPRGESHVVAVIFGEDEKGIYIDGTLINKKRTEINDTANIDFSGKLILGNSPAGKFGWWGEVKGLAIYDRILTQAEILAHAKEMLQKEMRGLVETPGLLALYLFDEGKGHTAENIVGKASDFNIPSSRNAFFTTIFNLPDKNMRTRQSIYVVEDCFRNLVFFIPFGVLYSFIILRKYDLGHFASFLAVIITGGVLSLAIEITQLFLPTRTAGILDVFCNVLGAMIGALIVLFLKGFRQRGSDR